MKKLLITLFLLPVLLPAETDRCMSDPSFSGNALRSGSYSVGDTISVEDQLAEYDICFGNYDADVFRLADANYLLNGGTPYVTMLRVNASW